MAARGGLRDGPKRPRAGRDPSGAGRPGSTRGLGQGPSVGDSGPHHPLVHPRHPPEPARDPAAGDRTHVPAETLSGALEPMSEGAVVIPPGQGHRIGNVEFLARTADTPRFNFSIIEIAAGRELDEHVHDAEDDAGYIVQGEMTF